MKARQRLVGITFVLSGVLFGSLMCGCLCPASADVVDYIELTDAVTEQEPGGWYTKDGTRIKQAPGEEDKYGHEGQVYHRFVYTRNGVPIEAGKDTTTTNVTLTGNRPGPYTVQGEVKGDKQTVKMTEAPPSPLPPEKREFVDAVTRYIEESHHGQGQSGDFIQIADPKRVRDLVANNVDSITVDTTRARPSTSVNWTDKNTHITLNQPPTANPGPALHELVHSGDYANGGNGIDDPTDREGGLPGKEGEGPELVSNGFAGTLAAAKVIDRNVEELLRKIKAGTATANDAEIVQKRLALFARQADEVLKDPSLARGLKALGGKYDPQGYIQAVNKKIAEAQANGGR